MADVRQKARDFLTQVPLGVDVTSNGSKAALFTTLTGMTHAGLQSTWADEDVAKQARRAKGESTKGLPTTTSCNGFTVKLGHAIGSTFSLGQFELETALKKAGLGEAWVPANSGKRPDCGDVFRMVKYHVGVSLEFVGDQWFTVEGGQGGPGADYTKGFDIVRRKQQVWNPASLLGWVDIEILMKLLRKTPKWMIGWWRFEVNAAKQFVWLPEKGIAQAFDNQPQNVKVAPKIEGKKGQLTLDDDSEGATIAWVGAAFPDTLRHLPGIDYMLGSRGPAQLQAFKLK